MSASNRFFKISDSEYENYARAAWQRYVETPFRAKASLAAVAELDLKRVLDIGCGAGHELIPFVKNRGCKGVGLDVVRETGNLGRELFESIGCQAGVSFLRGTAESLPFNDSSFDVVICRLALPYTENDRALQEIARVTRIGGALLLKIHHVRYYLRKMKEGFLRRDVLSIVHSTRVLFAGSIYYATNVQPRTRLTGGETFQTKTLLSRKLSRFGMYIQTELPDSNPTTPSFMIRKIS